MRIKELKILGRKCHCFATGKKWIIGDDIDGILAIVVNVTDPKFQKDNEETFEVYTGNLYCLGGSLTENVIQDRAQKFIRRIYKSRKCYFIERRAYRLNNFSLNIQITDEYNKIVG